jgi:hypothetical protein
LFLIMLLVLLLLLLSSQECVTPNDCPGDDSRCSTCNNGMCGVKKNRNSCDLSVPGASDGICFDARCVVRYLFPTIRTVSALMPAAW